MAGQIMIISGHKTMKNYEKHIKFNENNDLQDVIMLVNQKNDEKNDKK